MIKYDEYGEFFDKKTNLLVVKDDFEKRFDAHYEYNYLKNHPKTTPMWKYIFENWKSRGLLT